METKQDNKKITLLMYLQLLRLTTERVIVIGAKD